MSDRPTVVREWEGREEARGGHYDLAGRGERATDNLKLPDREGELPTKSKLGKKTVAPLPEGRVGEGLIFGDEGHPMVEAKAVGCELTREKGSDGGRDGVVEASFGGDVTHVKFQNGTEVGVGLAPVTSSVQGLKLATAARDYDGDAVWPKGREWSGGAGTNGSFKGATDAAEAAVDDERSSRRVNDAMGVVGAEAKLKSPDDGGVRLAYNVDAPRGSLDEVGTGEEGEGGFA